MQKVIDNIKDNIRENIKDSFNDNFKDTFKDNLNHIFKDSLSRTKLQGRHTGHIEDNIMDNINVGQLHVQMAWETGSKANLSLPRLCLSLV